MLTYYETVEQEEKLCDEVKSVREFTYLGENLNAGGRYETAVTSSTICGWVKFRELCEFLYSG